LEKTFMPERDFEYERTVEHEAIYGRIVLDGPFHRMSKVCFYCRNRYSIVNRTCAAYPRGIPVEIWNGIHDHRTPYPGDHNILFEPFPDETAAGSEAS
jgi:hypothetical protein